MTKIENIFNPIPIKTKIGNAGYDNQRENIDPHVRTGAVTTKEGTIQGTPVDNKDLVNKEYVDTPRYNNYLGSDCTGADKTNNRTLTNTEGVKLIILERKFLHPLIDYTVSANTITFLVPIDNRMNITIFY